MRWPIRQVHLDTGDDGPMNAGQDSCRLVPARSGRQIGTGRRGISQKAMQISMLAFEQALISTLAVQAA